jgi:predicted ABC-type ATPase
MRSPSSRPRKVPPSENKANAPGAKPSAVLSPALFIIAGAVGAGKTRFYEAHLKDAFPRLVPAVDENLDAALGAGKSFATEAYSIDKELLGKAKAAGFETFVLFIGTEDAALNAARVLNRMSRGGHAFPLEGVVDSYRNALKNLSEAREVVDNFWVYDNTLRDRDYQAVLLFDHGRLTKISQRIPDWVSKVFGKELLKEPAKQKEHHARGR